MLDRRLRKLIWVEAPDVPTELLLFFGRVTYSCQEAFADGVLTHHLHCVQLSVVDTVLSSRELQAVICIQDILENKWYILCIEVQAQSIHTVSIKG